MEATGSHRIQEIPHVKPRLDVVGSEKFASRTERMTAIFYHFRRKRNITGDDEVIGRKPFYDLIVSDIKTTNDLQESNVF